MTARPPLVHLDLATLSGVARTSGILYPGAGEAVIRSGGPRRGPARATLDDRGPTDNKLASADAAARRMRRFAKHNWLDAFVTLTCARAVGSEAEVNDLRARLIKRVRQRIGSFPAIVVAEPNAVFGWHLHALVPCGIASVFAETWTHGFVDTRLLRTSQDIVEKARYLAKTFAERSGSGRARYYVTRGFKPRPERFDADCAEDAVDYASERVGAPPDSLWRLPHDPRVLVAEWGVSAASNQALNPRHHSCLGSPRPSDRIHREGNHG